MLSMVDGFVALAVWADFLDDATSASALVTSDLRLREHAGEDLLANDLDTLAVAPGTGVNVAGRGRT